MLAPLDGYTLQPEGTLTLWCRPVGSALTAADFNARYGTSLVEGRDLLITEQPLLMADDSGHTLDLCLGEEQLCRAAYGNFCGGALPVADRPEQYAYLHDITIRMQRLESAPAAMGDLLPEQHLPVMAEQPHTPHVGNTREEKPVVTKLSKTPLAPLWLAKLYHILYLGRKIGLILKSFFYNHADHFVDSLKVIHNSCVLGSDFNGVFHCLALDFSCLHIGIVDNFLSLTVGLGL